MRFVYPLIVLFVFALSVIIFIATSVYSSPAEEAVAFLDDLKTGNLSRAVKRFGGNVCRCPAKGGWGSYLIYVSAQEPNLAFLVGHDFSMGKPVVHPLKKEAKHVLPWEKPEDTVVDIPLTFDKQKYQPLFLPLKMAYGHEMTEKELNEYVADPDREAWKGFYLRLRPSLQPGAIAPPRDGITPEALLEFDALRETKAKVLGSKANEKKSGTADTDSEPADEAARKGTSAQKHARDEAADLRELFGEDAADYIEPKEAGKVLRADGSEVPRHEVEEKLPRLSQTLMRLHVVRRGQLKDWTIYHFGTMENEVVFPDGRKLVLEHDRPPNYSEEKIKPVFKDDK